MDQHLSTQILLKVAIKRYALVVENEIFHTWVIDDSLNLYERWVEGFSQEHFGMEATGMDNVAIGSIWDGKKFILPEEKE